MASAIEVSAIIPTYNRRDLVQRAVESALAQTQTVDEIVVVDDGSTDGTGGALQARYGDRIRYLRQDNAGVSAARNAGMAVARGRYFALLDSDDLWLPEKTALQWRWLQARPDYGMVLCDVTRVDDDQRVIDVFHRRDVIREDGWVLPSILLNPSLVPASAMFRREVFDDVGGFDTALRTAEDIDFHLRVARRWRIGVVPEALVTAARGTGGLSATASTYDDYVRVVEKACVDSADTVPEPVRGRALAITYARNARGMLIRERWRDGFSMMLRALRASDDKALRADTLRLVPFAARRALASMLGR